MEFDNEHLIAEVERYPVLYDHQDESYFDRNAKIEAWKKVAEELVGEEYNTLDARRRNDLEREVQKKWKALKDAFMRSLKSRCGKSGKGAKRKAYYYHNQLAFLLRTFQNRSFAATMEENSNDEGDNQEEPDQERDEYIPPPQVVLQIPEEYVPPPQVVLQIPREPPPLVAIQKSEKGIPPPQVLGLQVPGEYITTANTSRDSCSKRKNEECESTLKYLLTKNKQPSAEETPQPLPPEKEEVPLVFDADKMFLLSLLPKMKSLNPAASFDFQINVMKLLQEYLQNPNHLRSDTTDTKS